MLFDFYCSPSNTLKPPVPQQERSNFFDLFDVHFVQRCCRNDEA